jgi:hypothetical protein
LIINYLQSNGPDPVPLVAEPQVVAPLVAEPLVAGGDESAAVAMGLTLRGGAAQPTDSVSVSNSTAEEEETGMVAAIAAAGLMESDSPLSLAASEASAAEDLDLLSGDLDSILSEMTGDLS